MEYGDRKAGRYSLNWLTRGPKKKLVHADGDIFLLNYDGLPWFDRYLKEQKIAMPFDMLVLDESTSVKDPKTRRFKLLKGLLDQFPRRVILTGTPAPNSMLDLYGQIYVLDKGAALGRTIYVHKNMFWEQNPYKSYEWTLKPGAKETITERIAPMVKRMSSEMYLQLPKLITQDIRVELPPKVMELYLKMEKHFFSLLDDGVLEAANAAVASGKLRQICSGGFYYDDPSGTRQTKHIHEVKTQAVKELVDQIGGEPVMIMYEFAHELERLKKAFPNAAVIRGGISGDRLAEICEQWNEGEIPILLVQPQSASHGLNLQGGGRHMIWTTTTWSGERYHQAIKRLHRSGQKQTVFIHRIIAEQTIDEAVIEALESKEAGQSEFLSAIYKLRSERTQPNH